MYVRYNERRMFEDFSTLIDTGFRYLVEIISLAFVSWYQTGAESPKILSSFFFFFFFFFFFSRFGNSSFRYYSISQTPGWEMRVVGNETLKTEISLRSNSVSTPPSTMSTMTQSDKRLKRLRKIAEETIYGVMWSDMSDIMIWVILVWFLGSM